MISFAPLSEQIPTIVHRINNQLATLGISMDIPDGRQVELVTFEYTLNTDANVADRFPVLALTRNGTIFQRIHPAAVVTASSSITISYNQGIGAHFDGTAVLNQSIPLPKNLVMQPGDGFVLTIGNAQAADALASISFSYNEAPFTSA